MHYSLRRMIACIGLTAVSSVALAQSYPEKTVRVVVPYSAGGPADILARLVAKSLGAHFGQSFVIDNRGGAGGVIAHEVVAKAVPDGYTLLYSAAGPLTVSPHIYTRLSYDPLKTFVPIKLTAFVPQMLVVNPKIQATTVKQLIAEAIASPGKLSYASGGAGSAAHLAAELFKSLTGTEIAHVAYKGDPPALIDLMAGQIDMMIAVLASALPHVKAGRLRALAVTSTARSALAPNVPTMQEAGVKDFDTGTWFGLLALAGTNPQIITSISRALDKAMAQPEFTAAVASQGGELSR
ncbi:MAG: tripartite tricarboxylate transporter substrate binding protein, partial [Sulfuricaulis sp.]|nr:tripartite tricarboxylate transporter substrate binding protein [Sulfuricaulis sp.]